MPILQTKSVFFKQIILVIFLPIFTEFIQSRWDFWRKQTFDTLV